jgi:hypothetical protein
MKKRVVPPPALRLHDRPKLIPGRTASIKRQRASINETNSFLDFTVAVQAESFSDGKQSQGSQRCSRTSCAA